MIIKTFTEDSSAAALKRVRKEMGGDAIVLKTRQVTKAGKSPVFEVTACLENATVAQSSDLLSGPQQRPEKPATEPAKSEPETEIPEKVDQPAQEYPATQTTDSLDDRISAIDRKLNQLLSLGIQPDGIARLEMFQTVHRRLKEADLPDDFLESFMSSLVENYDGRTDIDAFARQTLIANLADTTETEINFDCGDRVVFFGPAGSGKSSVMGKLAASLAAKCHRKVRLLSLDDCKLAAFDEICSYADILGLEVVPPPAADVKSDTDDDAVTLIDTPAMPVQRQRIQTLKQKIEEIAPRYRFAVFSCLTRSRDVFQISKTLKELNPTHLILTMQDLASCHGTVITAAKATGLKIAFLSDTPGGMGELRIPDPLQLADRLMNIEVPSE
ncbi:MAG: hypothetical protein JSU74_08700 [Candidatus Zixiibacteriota bacterium]|nr:MAG: hypothetical protein JSU74_08700 [candidate division Zixibacteria bacterium]